MLKVLADSYFKLSNLDKIVHFKRIELENISSMEVMNRVVKNSIEKILERFKA